MFSKSGMGTAETSGKRDLKIVSPSKEEVIGRSGK